MRVSALVPAFNEAQNVGATIAGIRAACEPVEIIVVDDGSVDGTAIAADSAGADAVLRQANRGKGAALAAAAAVCSGDIFLLLDADIGDSSREGGKLLAPVVAGAADMTVAVFQRTTQKGGGAGLAVRLARWGIFRLTGVTFQAPICGQRALTRELADCAGFASGWGVEVSLTVNALRSVFRVMEVPVDMTHRVTGRSPAAVAHRARQFFQIALTLWRLRGSKSALFRPRRRRSS